MDTMLRTERKGDLVNTFMYQGLRVEKDLETGEYNGIYSELAGQIAKLD